MGGKPQSGILYIKQASRRITPVIWDIGLYGRGNQTQDGGTQRADGPRPDPLEGRKTV